jgi:Serine/threonine protein kinase
MLRVSSRIHHNNKSRRMLQQILYFLTNIIQRIFLFVKEFLHPAQTIDFDNGHTVTIRQKIAEGGFSYIYCATDSLKRTYALKRIICSDDDILQSCRKEINVHRQVRGENVLHLFDCKFVNYYNATSSSSSSSSSSQRICYMLFPFITGGSLRDQVNRRNLLSDDLTQVKPIKERQVLTLFKGVLEGVKSLHRAGYAHCDVKLENVLLDISHLGGYSNYSHNGSDVVDEEMSFEMTTTTSSSSSSRRDDLGIPILMDFGSARELVVKLVDRKTVLRLTEDAAQYSTISYRAPELFEGGLRHGPLEADVDGKVDVWSCGCLLFGLMYGASPFEMEFRQRSGTVRIVDCTHLRVLGGKIPQVPASREAVFKYSQQLQDLVEWILTVDRTERPTIEEVCQRVEQMLVRPSASGVSVGSRLV